MVCLVAMATTGSAFSSLAIAKKASWKYSPLSSSVVDEETSVEVHRRSDRLEKAKLLLDQLSDQQGDEIDLMPPLQQSPSATISINSNAPAAVVPDSVWWNGNLQGDSKGTNYVTRWSRGVKVAEPLVRYDPIKAEKLLFRQPAKWLVRNAQIALPLGWWAVNLANDFLLGRQKLSSFRRERAQQLTAAISSLGPAIIKGGQALASRPDLLPAEYLEELQKLQDDVPRFSNEVAFQTVEEELQLESFDELFELEFEEPVAAASIGQVYRARLVNGETVALKIQRPGCEDIVALDCKLLIV